MAYVKARVGRYKIEDFIALNGAVVNELDNRTFEIAVRAEGYLAEHQDYDDDTDAHSYIDVERGRIDRYVVLNDERGQNAALSIEYGRAAYEVEREDENGNTYTEEVGAMPGLYVLARASNLPKKRKGKVIVD
ncbi:hypothetical protein SEA_EDDASA_14 [Streptomyces phage Eddasa]|uniref:Uncharacterized protein n=7 Tax=Likavirus TaxID=1982880 RepID=A0A2U8UTS9_9CAUD|nr:hypothetical protein SEA_BEARDEDLADY_14 [Streptomyces phage BeardedLady]ATE84967.1 hypothetical protein SEA_BRYANRECYCLES_14 [Streptomyces phage BryanRecycles]ATE85269.1 hypothetical protein SEA_JASH_14 [Streptomyces phage Jash]ATE85344.1 hypothetical protein SEA_OLIYNYK_14 [Streptomyces phage Oliynyk]ATE85418.1 hypothetical protein SEA_OZZIE_13 [Streptomyces phage Ozzie]AWN07457.1 hypothetical protein SEA_EDDASA_14 [Streptomyces phage Eddasa]QDK03945.1 hypothetical protein SEA_RUSTICUS_14